MGSEANIEPVEELASEPTIINKLVTWGYKKYSGSREIDTIIIHSAYDALGDDPYSVEGVIKEFRTYQVSPHYLIDREGSIYQLVDDNNIAYHAGVSEMPDGRIGVNNFSIGIELIYHQSESPNEAQYQSLAKLVKYKAEAYNIPLANILGHEAVAPGRKTDPWNFDWGKFEKMIE
ncbi:N-acetylmuramoyl-L-alanine amidase [Patescibacteria group bacterium]|nr:N-acetylmuramoyl-L-alanine amidase [Patescibacteria group bacterium]